MKLSADDLEELRQLAESAAGQAGRLLNANQATWSEAEVIAGHDVKVRGDREAEALIVGLLGRGSGLPVFGEESGLMGLGSVDSANTVWVVDPLDGTANYERGVPACCVSIALCLDETALVGVVYDFNRDEMFSGIAAPSANLSGAWLNGREMCVSGIKSPGEGLLATGFPVASDFESSALSEYVRSVQQFRKVRSLGIAALMLAYVASGRFDAYTERNVRFWDVAAGTALVQAAGGKVTERSAESGFARRLDLRAWNGAFDFD